MLLVQHKTITDIDIIFFNDNVCITRIFFYLDPERIAITIFFGTG